MDLMKNLVFLSAVLLSGAAEDTCNMAAVCEYCLCDNLSVTCTSLVLRGKPFFPLVCENVTKLQINSSDIAEINSDDMSHLTNLKVFNVTNSPLSTISGTAFRSLTSLETLALQNNKLSELQPDTFVGLEKIQQITITGTFVTAILLKHFRTLNATLQTLDLSHNNIKEITGGLFNDTNVLTALDLSENAFTTLNNKNLTFLPNVTDLYMEHNVLHSVDSGAFDNMTSLKTLNLANNQLQNLPADIFRNLAVKSLNLSDNQLSLIPTRHNSTMDNLETLDLDGNSLSEISGGIFSSFSKLKELRLSRNNPLAKVNDRAFDTQSKLERLYLSYNRKLVEIHPNTFSAGFPTLGELYINDNGFESIPEAMFNGTALSGLTKVEAQGNPLKCSCDVIWIKNDMDNDTFDWIEPWKRGNTALICKSPKRFNGTMIYQTDVNTLTCSPPKILEEVQFFEEENANHFIEVLVSNGLPTTEWKIPSGIILAAGNKHDPGDGNNIVSVQEVILTNDTVSSQLLINHPTYETKGYNLTVVNAGGSVMHRYYADPPELPDGELIKAGLVIVLAVAGVIIVTLVIILVLVACLVYLTKKKLYEQVDN